MKFALLVLLVFMAKAKQIPNIPQNIQKAKNQAK